MVHDIVTRASFHLTIRDDGSHLFLLLQTFVVSPIARNPVELRADLPPGWQPMVICEGVVAYPLPSIDHDEYKAMLDQFNQHGGVPGSIVHEVRILPSSTLVSYEHSILIVEFGFNEAINSVQRKVRDF